MLQTFKYLTTRELIYRKCVDLFMPFIENKNKLNSIIVPGYTLLKNLTMASAANSALIGIFMKNETKTKVFIKKYVFNAKGVRYASLMNELAILKLLTEKKLTRINDYNVVIPALKNVITKNSDITIICEYVEGERLYNLDENVKLETLSTIFKAMKVMNKKLQGEMENLPKRSSEVLALSFIFFWLQLCIKEPQQIAKNIWLFIEFYKNYFLTQNKKNMYGLVHRDLHSRNILLNKNDIIITDWEGAVITDSWYDLAMVPRIYMHELSLKNIINLLNTLLETKTDVKRFLLTTIFYSVQTLALDKKHYTSYIDTIHYIETLQKQIKPKLLN